MRLRHRVSVDTVATHEHSVPAAGRRVLVGGVGYRWMGDASFGLALSDALSDLRWPGRVDVEDLGYGAIYAAQDIGDADPPYTCLILLAGVVRGREPAQIYCQRWQPRQPAADELQTRIREAGAGVIDLDHLLAIGEHFQALPGDVLLVEVEPVALSGAALSESVAELLPAAIAEVRQKVLSHLQQGERRDD